MGQVSGTTDTYDLVGIAEDIHNTIYNVSPEETPFLTMAKRLTADNTTHQWQADELADATNVPQIEGDDASYATATPTVMYGNRTQIQRKTVLVSDTADRVRKYGRDKEFVYQSMKRGMELKRDFEKMLVQNAASSAGGSATARSSAGFESWITQYVVGSANTTHTTPGFVTATGLVTAPTDGTLTASAIGEADVKAMLELAWSAGGSSDVIMTNTVVKQDFAAFAGTTASSGYYDAKAQVPGSVVLGSVSYYISDFGEHKIVLNRYMRQGIAFGIDPGYVGVAWLRPIKSVPLAKTGDATKGMVIGEATLVVHQPKAHCKAAFRQT